MANDIASGKTPFTISVEFTPHSRADLILIARMAQGLVALNETYREHDIVFDSVALTQNPGGHLSYDHAAAIAILRAHGFPEEDLAICPHITGKDMNQDGVRSLLISLRDLGIRRALALTGDLSDQSKGVFEIGSLGILRLIRELNMEALSSATDPTDFATRPLLEPAAAVSPFKYTEASLAMQYIKARKKIREGAVSLICQCGWDVDRSEHLIQELGPEAERPADARIIGNVLVATFPVARYMQSLPGCVISEAFLAALEGRKLDSALERAGHQVALFRQLGYSGVELGKPGEFKTIHQIERILDTALAIGDWRDVKANIHFPLVDSPPPPVRHSAAFSRLIHNLALRRNGPFHKLAQTVLSPVNRSAEREGALYKAFNAFEGIGKKLLYQCEHCGDCFGPENDYVCTLGQCEKGLNNPPCGDADPQGFCGNNPNRVCVGETLYYRLQHHGDLDQYKNTILEKRDVALRDTASLLNYYFGRDHHAKHANPFQDSGLTPIGDRIRARHQPAGAAMRCIQDSGDRGFRRPHRGRALIEYLMETQWRQGACQILIDLDGVEAADPAATLRRYVDLLREVVPGAAPCLRSRNPEAQLSAMQEWIARTTGSPASCRRNRPSDQPKALVGPIRLDDSHWDDLIALRETHPFGIICPLAEPDQPIESTDAMLTVAWEIWDAARSAGFQADDIFMDPLTAGVLSDGGYENSGAPRASHTWKSFRAMEVLRRESAMKGLHIILDLFPWAEGVAPRFQADHRRAFLEAAKKAGVDTILVDLSEGIGARPAPPAVIALMEAIRNLDGSDAASAAWQAAMASVREAGRL